MACLKVEGLKRLILTTSGFVQAIPRERRAFHFSTRKLQVIA
jgi:hypothetical protein